MKIKISKKLSTLQKESTFLHEWLEGVNHTYAIGLRHLQIEGLESALYQLFKQTEE